ncbi:MAG: tyrosine-type recombinase/integrase, partial [Archaeoglobaceae archaeon]
MKRFSEFCSYSTNLNNILIYINEIEAPFVEKIDLPSKPRRLKKVIKLKEIQNTLKKLQNFSELQKLRLTTAILISATSGIRAEELYKLQRDNVDVEERMINIDFRITKDYEERLTFFSEEAKQWLESYLSIAGKTLFPETSIRRCFRKLDSFLGLRHMRKFFSQQSDRLGMPTTIKK